MKVFLDSLQEKDGFLLCAVTWTIRSNQCWGPTSSREVAPSSGHFCVRTRFVEAEKAFTALFRIRDRGGRSTGSRNQQNALTLFYCNNWYTKIEFQGRPWRSPINGILRFSSRFSCDTGKLLSLVIAMRHNNFSRKPHILESAWSNWTFLSDEWGMRSSIKTRLAIVGIIQLFQNIIMIDHIFQKPNLELIYSAILFWMTWLKFVDKNFDTVQNPSECTTFKGLISSMRRLSQYQSIRQQQSLLFLVPPTTKFVLKDKRLLSKRDLVRRSSL